jgi:hypothetical protein
MRVTMLLASALKSISDGLVPVHFPAMRTGSGPLLTEVVVREVVVGEVVVREVVVGEVVVREVVVGEVVVREGAVAGVEWTEVVVLVTVVVRTTVLVAPPQPAATSPAATANQLMIPACFMLRMMGAPLTLRPREPPQALAP